jgi:hypothetical protein
VQNQKTLLSLLAISTATILISIIPIQTATAILLRITSPDQGEKIPAGSFLTVTGTAAPSNATHTKCNVQLQTNQNGYKHVTPLGSAGTYTNWKGTTSEPVKVGANQVEGQLLCYAASGTTPNLIKHLVHNFTGIETLNANSTNVNPPSTIKQSGIPIVPTVLP